MLKPLIRLLEIGPSDGERVRRAGGYVDIGPQCFALADGSLISWRGENYTPQRPTLRVRLHNWLVRHAR